MRNKIRVSGVDLACESFGTGPRDLLFIHGYMVRGTGRLYAPLYEQLGSHFRVLAIDLRGHGGSSGITDATTFDELATDIAAAVHELGLDQPIYVGHSLGGLLGLRTELECPGIFGGIVLLAPAAATGAGASDPASLDRAVQLHRDHKAMAANFRGIYVRDVPDSHIGEVVEAACLLDPAFNEDWLTREWPTVDISRRLQEIETPTLVLNGARDNIVSPDAQHRTAMSLPRCKEVTFTDEGHMLPLESPERTAREIVSFYDDEIAQGTP